MGYISLRFYRFRFCSTAFFISQQPCTTWITEDVWSLHIQPIRGLL